MAEVVQHCRAGGQAGTTHTWEDLHASFLSARARRAGPPEITTTVTPPVVGQPEATLPPALAQRSRRHGARQQPRQQRACRGRSCESSGGGGKSRSKSRSKGTDAAAASASPASVWVWEPNVSKDVTAKGVVTSTSRGPRKQQQQVAKGVTAAEDDDGPAKASSVVDRKKMFADVASSSSCSTVDLTASESGSKTSSPTCVAALDDSFWNELSEYSMQFPEPPTRVPTPASCSSSALTISGFGKNITSTLPSVHLILPPRWRKRLQSAGSSKRSCRKSSSRWIARSKATGSMSEASVFARAVSFSDGTLSLNRREAEAMVAAGADAGAGGPAVSHESAPAAVSYEPAAAVAPRLAEAAGCEPFPAADLPEEIMPELVEIAGDGEGAERQQRQQEQQEQDQQDQQHRAVPSALPTPVAAARAPSTPPPAPLFTAPRPPPSSQPPQTPGAARRPLRRTCRCFGSSISSSQGSAREGRLTSPSPYLTTPPRMTMENRLASTGSSIFDEEGDDSKKTKWLNPYTLSPPAPAVAAAAAAGSAAVTSHALPLATGASATVRAPEAGNDAGAAWSPSPCSPGFFWARRSPSDAAAAAAQQQQHQHQSVFVVGAGWGKKRRDAAVRALGAEINRRDAQMFGDQRRRMKNGESGIWLPSPGIWSSGRRPTPLNADMYPAWG